jgi:hypothetical protein
LAVLDCSKALFLGHQQVFVVDFFRITRGGRGLGAEWLGEVLLDEEAAGLLEAFEDEFGGGQLEAKSLGGVDH